MSGIRIKGREQRRREADGRFCYGATCTWFGSIHEVKATPEGLPCCPLCGGVLFEMQDEGEWWRGIDDFEKGEYPLPTSHPHPGYRAMWEWQRAEKRCFTMARDGMKALATAYEQATGRAVDVSR